MSKINFSLWIFAFSIICVGALVLGNKLMSSEGLIKEAVNVESRSKIVVDTIPNPLNDTEENVDSLNTFYKTELIDGVAVPIHITGNFSWSSKNPDRPISSISEKHPGILVYRLAREVPLPKTPYTIGDINGKVFFKQSYDRVEFIGSDRKSREILFIDSLMPEILRNSSLPKYEYSNPEIEFQHNQNSKVLSVSSYWFEKNVYVLKNGFVNITFEVDFISNKCDCPFKRGTWYNLYDENGTLVFSRQFFDKSLYEFSVDNDGKYLGISWDQTNDYTVNNEGLRGVYVYSISNERERIYGDSLSMGDGHMTRIKLQENSSSFNYKLRDLKGKTKDFYSTYIIVDPGSKSLFFKDFSRKGWKKLQDFDWSLSYPSAIVEEFKFEKNKL